jgi:hypothetical protein
MEPAAQKNKKWGKRHKRYLWLHYKNKSPAPGRVVFDFTLWLPCKRGTRNPTPHFQCTFSRQSGECANTAQKPIALSG